MPKREQAPIGAPCWVDLTTSDPQKSIAFYGELFGWKATDAGEQFGHYINFTKDDIPVAGGMGNDDAAAGRPDAWSVYLAVDDAAATVAAAAARGSDVVVPAMAVGDLGTMAVVTDPGRAGIGIWQPGLHKGFGIYGEPGSPGWFELHTSAYRESVAFYTDVFGWDAHTMSDTPDFRYTTYGADDGALAGIMDSAAFPPGHPTSWSVYFAADDTDKALARVEQLGGEVLAGAHDTPYGRLADAADSTGARFKLVANG